MFDGGDHLYGVPGTFTVSECASCSLRFQNPRPTAESLDGLYPETYTPHTFQEEVLDPPLDARVMRYLQNDLGYRDLPLEPKWAPAWWQRWKADVDLIPRFVPGGTLLEIGAATGSRLRALRAVGWSDLHGIEMVDAAAAVARRGGLDVRTGSVETFIAAQPEAAFDAVVASFVFEHLYDPFAIVREVARVLKPGGELLFSTITRDSIDARMWGEWWAGYDLPRHMVYFSNRDLRLMTAEHFDWDADARHDAIQDFARESWWRLMDHRNLTDRIVGRLVKTRAGQWTSSVLAWTGLACRISVRCRRR